jgi:hypothetical protein
VAAWIAGVRSDLGRVDAALAPLVEEQARLRSREALLMKLLHSFDGVVEATTATPGEEPREVVPEGSMREYVREHALAILHDRGGAPMHINDLHAQFVARGYRVPGAGRPANLTAHLGRCEGIVSPSRGFYAVGETPAKPPQRKRRRRRRR